MSTLRSLVILTIAVTTALATTVAGALQEEQPPRFTTEVAAVLVDVLVLDSDGRPVSGLTVEDFEVFEDEVKQEIQNFDIIDWTSYVARKAPTELEPVPPDPTTSVNTFPRRFIFIINRQGAEFGYMVRARKALEMFVIESMADGDEAMVIDMGMSTRVTQEFTPFKEEVLQSVKKLMPMPAALFYGTLIGTRGVYETLEAMGEALAAFPGRKVVVFMSPELSRTRELLPDLQRTVDALNQSNTTVYSIDIEGVGIGMGADEDGFEQASAELGGFDAATIGGDSFDVGGLFPLAYETGGRYFYNLETFEPAVQRIGQENRRYYLLTYIPANTEFDKKYRRIEVRVNRPNVTVKARKGYFPRKPEEPVVADASQEKPTAPPAPPKAQPTPEGLPDQPAAPVNMEPRPPTQVEITNYLFPAADGKVDVPIAVALPLELLTAGKGPSTLKLTMTDGSGTEVGNYSVQVSPQKFSSVLNATLDPGSYLLQITLTQAGKEIYKASTQVDVPSNFGERFGLSTITPIYDPAEAEKVEGPPIRPTPTLRMGENAFIYFRVFPGRRGEPSKSVEIIYSVYREDEEIASLKQPEPADLTKSGEYGFPVIVRLPTGNLQPGIYRVVVRISDPNLGRRASGGIELTVIP
jgi:VWFA-related protein